MANYSGFHVERRTDIRTEDSLELHSVRFTDSYAADFHVVEYEENYAWDYADFHAEELSLYAKSAVIIDAETGRILYGKSAQTPMANASTTKILTCILALENADLDEVVTVSDYACTMPKVKLGFSSGDQFYLGDLLYSLMLESHNDTAVAIAEHVSGSVEAFAKLMNEKAEALGCTDSHFVTPNGLDAEDEDGAHQTTAYDLAKIMAYCIQNEQFLEITRTASKEVSTVDGAKSYSLTNHNALLTMLDGALSGKTGFTANAGYCYVGAYQSGGHTFTFALLACGWPNNKNYKWSDSKQLISYVEANYSDRVIVEGTETLKLPLENAVAVDCVENQFSDDFEQSKAVLKTDDTVPGDGSLEFQYNVSAQEADALNIQNSSAGQENNGSKGMYDSGRISFPTYITAETTSDTITAFLSDSDEIEITYDIPDSIQAPAVEGTIVGTENICINGELYATREITLTESVEQFDYAWCFHRVLQQFLITSS